MLILSSTADLFRVVTTTTSDTKVHATWVDRDPVTSPATTVSPIFTPGRTNTATITTATTTTVVGSPAASVQRTVNLVTIRNKHASASQTVTIIHTDGTTAHEITPDIALAAGEMMTLDGRGVWFVYDVNGAVKSASAPASSDTGSGVIEIAVQSEQETGTDVVRAVTPGRQHFHPSAAKAWLGCGVTANILGSYNITSLTDTGTGDVAVTIATDFSAATTYAWVMCVQRTNSTAAAANARCGTIKTATIAAGTISMDCWDDTATTNVISDPTTWHAAGFGDFA